MLFDLKRSAGSVREKGTGFILQGAPCSGWRKFCVAAAGRNAPGCNGWICAGRGEVEDLAVEWDLRGRSAVAWLGDPLLSGNGKSELRQAALHLYSEGFDAEEAADI